MTFLALAVVLGSDVGPTVRLFHVLLAIALALALIGAWAILTLVHRGSRRMFVIDVTITFLFCWPSIFVVLAALLGTFPWSGMGLLMFPFSRLVML